MVIEKIINNNVVSAINPEGRQVVLMGKGIGFGVTVGSFVSEDKVEKVFKMDSQKSFDRFKELLVTLPIEHIQVSNKIIDYAKETLGKRLNQNVYITLTDHINFAVERYSQGMDFSNPLLWEVKKFYPSEYLIGEYAISLIKEQLNVSFGDDEAASIALHIVNAEYNTSMSEAMNITNLICDVLEIVKLFVKTEIDDKSLHYARFITHLKYLSQRINTNEQIDSDEHKFLEIITSMYPKEYECSQKIATYVKDKYNYKIAAEELLYLTIHIKRIQENARSEEIEC